MKRFFLVFALSSVVAIFLVIKFNIPIAIIVGIAALLLIGAIALHFKLKVPYTVLIVTIITSFMITYFYTNWYIATSVEPTKKFVNKETEITAVVLEEPSVYEEYSSVAVKAIDNNSSIDGVRILLSYNNVTLKYNDVIKFKTTIRKQTFTSFYSDKLFLKGHAQSIKIVDNKGDNLYSKAIYFRSYITNVFLSKLNDDVAGIPVGMLTGNRDYLSDEFYANVKSTGMMHVMAVSGLHISIICLSIVNLLKKYLKSNKFIPSIIGIAIVVAMAAIAGFTGSIMRAGIMCLSVFIGDLFFRKADPLNSLGIAFTVLIISNPYNIYSVSLILSALGTLGILLFSNKLSEMLIEIYPFDKFLRKTYSYYVNILSVTLTATLFIIPVSLIVFGYISTISPIVNLILSPIIFACLILSVLAVLVCKIPFVNTIILFAVEFLCKIYKLVIDYFASFELNVFYADDIMLYVFLALVVVIITLIVICGRTKTMTLLLSLLLCIVLPVFSIIQHEINSDKIKYYFPSAQKGSAMVIENNEKFVLVLSTTDNSTFKQIKTILNNKLSPEIDAVIIPNDDKNAYNKAFNFLKQYGVKTYLLCSNKYMPDAKILTSQKLEIWNSIILKPYETSDGFNLYFEIGDSAIVFDNFCASANEGDYVVTSDMISNYKINGNRVKYIVPNESNKSKQAALTDLGVKAAFLNDKDILFATQNNNKELNFAR